MNFGILKDVKSGEKRVICTPVEVSELVRLGHTVYAQRSCGTDAGFEDEQYRLAGAKTVDSTEEIFEKCDMVAKVKELTKKEQGLLRPGQIILACLHPAANPEEVDALLKSKCIAFTAEDSHRYGSVNCEAAGKAGALFGIGALMSINGGKGKYVGGFAGAPGIKALILGGGLVGENALSVLYALGASCTVADISTEALRRLSEKYSSRIDTVYCSKKMLSDLLPQTDLVMNCVKWQKNNSDFLITRKMVSTMPKNSVIVDISNDSPGAIETCRTTTHDNPTFKTENVIHYCVSNIPSAFAHSTSVSYAAAMLPMISSLLSLGVKKPVSITDFTEEAL